MVVSATQSHASYLGSPNNDDSENCLETWHVPSAFRSAKVVTSEDVQQGYCNHCREDKMHVNGCEAPIVLPLEKGRHRGTTLLEPLNICMDTYHLLKFFLLICHHNSYFLKLN